MNQLSRPLRKVISGGQSGVDRGALDAALANNFPCGGWCPEGRQAEDGVIDARYPLQELPGGYRARTARNVADSDGTVIVFFDRLEGGSAHTRDDCRASAKPLLLIDGSSLTVRAAKERLTRFIREHDIRVLNVAGPRHSDAEQGYKYVLRFISELLSVNPTVAGEVQQ